MFAHKNAFQKYKRQNAQGAMCEQNKNVERQWNINETPQREKVNIR